jgi:hypothetical protein
MTMSSTENGRRRLERRGILEWDDVIEAAFKWGIAFGCRSGGVGRVETPTSSRRQHVDAHGTRGKGEMVVENEEKALTGVGGSCRGHRQRR